MQDAVEIRQNMKTSLASSLSNWRLPPPNNETLSTNQVLKRGLKVKGKTGYILEAVFARLVKGTSISQTFSSMSSVPYLPQSSTNTAASEKGAR